MLCLQCWDVCSCIKQASALSAYLLLLTPRCRVLPEQLTGLQLVKKFPAFHETRRFITSLTSVRHLSLSWASPIQSIYPHPTSWRSILILSTHLRLGLPSGLLPSGFRTKTLYTPLSSPIRSTCPAQLFQLQNFSCHIQLVWIDYTWQVQWVARNTLKSDVTLFLFFIASKLSMLHIQL